MRTFFRRLALIVIWPRRTMRQILDGPRDRATLLLVFLAVCSGLVSNQNSRVTGALATVTPKTWLIVVCVIILNIAILLLLFYGCAWLATVVGRFLEGEGQLADVRSALAWGVAPAIWALLYRVPAAIWGPAHGLAQMKVGSQTVRIDPGQVSSGCLAALVFGVLELGVLVWYFVVASRALAEAHRFSAWRGFATLLVIAATPIVVIIAAVLSMH